MKTTVVFVLVSLVGCLASGQEPEPMIEIGEAQLTLVKNAVLASPIDGIVDVVLVHEGDVINKETDLVALNSDQAETELAAAQAALHAARLQSENDVDERYARRALDVQQRELTQSTRANQRFAGSVSESEIEKLRLVVDQSRLAIEQAQFERQVAAANAEEKAATARIVQSRLDKHAVKSSIAGMVAEVNVQPGEWVETGKPIIRVISLDPLRVECFIDGRKYGKELVGHEVRFQPYLSEEPVVDSQSDSFSGKVVFVSPELHPVTGQARLWATLPNPDQKIRAGMRGKLVVLKKAADKQ